MISPREHNRLSIMRALPSPHATCVVAKGSPRGMRDAAQCVVTGAFFTGCLMVLVSFLCAVPASYGEDPSPGNAQSRALDLAVQILEDRVTTGAPRVQRVAFTTLSEYYCRPGGNRAQCAQFIVDGMQHEHWQVRLEALLPPGRQ